MRMGLWGKVDVSRTEAPKCNSQDWQRVLSSRTSSAFSRCVARFPVHSIESNIAPKALAKVGPRCTRTSRLDIYRLAASCCNHLI